MSVKLIIPITGLTGSVAGIVGFGGIGSNKSVAEIPLYSRELKSIDSVEVSYNCNRDILAGGASRVGVFTVRVKKDELKGKENELLEGKVVEAGIEYNFKVDSDFKEFKLLAVKGKAHMTVSSNYDGGLKIVLKEEKMNAVRLSDVNLYCQIDSSKGNKEIKDYWRSDLVFEDSVELDSSKKTVSLDRWSGKAKVSSYKCPIEIEERENSTCELKVSDWSGWKWVTKINANVQFEFLPARAK